MKNLLKKIFPLMLLRQWQLRANKLRIRTIDRLLFPEHPFQPADFQVQRDGAPFRLYSIESGHLDPRLRRQFEQQNRDWTQDEYLLVYEQPCVIEPRYGWALSADGQLIYPSLGFSRAPYLPKPDVAVKKLLHAPLEEYAELISLRDTGEENYYHFYNDVLAKLFFLDEHLKLAPEVPVLISKRLYDRPFFQYFLVHPYLRDRHWVVQDEQYIRSRRTYFCKPLTHTPSYYGRVLAMARPEDLAPADAPERRLFVTRSPHRLRYVENNAEVAAICARYGFEMVDFDELTLPQQIRAISGARYVVGIHGAGLVNMLYRGGRPMGLLEIYPAADYFPFHYVLMANQLGFDYDGIIGLPGSLPFSGAIRVDEAEFERRLTALLAR